MQFAQRMLLLAALFPLSASWSPAQSPADPSGHREGTIQMQATERTFDLDLMKNGQGEISGAIHVPAGKVPGIPIRVTLKDGSVNFHARVDQPFSGQLGDSVPDS